MALGGLEAINWSAPWLEPWRDPGELVARSIATDSDGALAEALSNHCIKSGGESFPVRFVHQSELPAGQSYEQFIFDTSRVPTRDGLHDFFNGLCWMHFPATKKLLNRLHVDQIAKSAMVKVRGPARDAITVFDENAAFLQAPDALWNALQAKDWLLVFTDLRELWKESRLILFGHALLEKLATPRKAITAHVIRIPQIGQSITQWDAWLSQHLTSEYFASKPFAHLPVLGVPGWNANNEDPGFYADPSVFRRPRLPDQ